MNVLLPTHVSRTAQRTRLRVGKERERGKSNPFSSRSREGEGEEEEGVEERDTRTIRKAYANALEYLTPVLHRTLTLRYRWRRLAATTLSHFGLSYLFRCTYLPALCLLKSPLVRSLALVPVIEAREIVASLAYISTCLHTWILFILWRSIVKLISKHLFPVEY